MSEAIDLKQIREKKGISLEQIVQDTKISKRILEAFEKGDLSDLFLSEVYLKGFAKTYARYLGIDEEELVRQLFGEPGPVSKKAVGTHNLDTDAAADRASHSKVSKYLDILISFGKKTVIFLFLFVVGMFLKLPKRFLLGIGVALLSLFIVVFFLTHRAAHDSDLPFVASKGEALDEIAQKDVSEEESSSSSIDADKEAIPAVVEPQEKKDTFSVIVEALDDCWIRVKADGIELFRKTLNKGDIEKWEAKRQLSMWVGNAGVLKVRCGDKVYEGLGRRGRVIKDVVFYPDCTYEIKKR